MISRANRLQALGIEGGGGWHENRPTQNWITGDRLEAIIDREADTERRAQENARKFDRESRKNLRRDHLQAVWSRDPLADQARDGLNGYRRQ